MNMKKILCAVLAIVMVLAMAACADENKDAYKAALAAYESGDYESASLQLYALGDYKDAAEKLANIRAEIAGVTVETKTAEGTVTATVECVYQDGNLIKENITHADGTVTKNYYKYDDQGLCTSEILNHRDGGKTKLSHFYEDGIRVRTVRTNPNDSKDTFVYTSENGKITAHTLTLSDGTTEEAVYTYAETTGRLVSVKTGEAETVYTYDQFGNVTNELAGETEISYIYNYSYFIS